MEDNEVTNSAWTPPYLFNEDVEEIDEATSGSAWMFYNHYNPELLKAMQEVIVGHKVEDVVNRLLETDVSLCKGACSKCLDGTCEVGKSLDCQHQAKAEK